MQGGAAPPARSSLWSAHATTLRPTARSPVTPWRLVALRRPGAAEEPVGPDPAYTVEFGAEGRYSGRRTATASRAPTSAPSRVLTVRAGAATLVACPQPSIADEYLRALASVTRYQISGEELRLSYAASGELRFVREPQQAAAAPEVGRTFVFDCDAGVELHDTHRARRGCAVGAGVARRRLSDSFADPGGVGRAVSRRRHRLTGTAASSPRSSTPASATSTAARTRPRFRGPMRRAAARRSGRSATSLVVRRDLSRPPRDRDGARRKSSRVAARRARRRRRPNDVSRRRRWPRGDRRRSTGGRARTACPAKGSKPRRRSTSRIERCSAAGGFFERVRRS